MHKKQIAAILIAALLMSGCNSSDPIEDTGIISDQSYELQTDETAVTDVSQETQVQLYEYDPHPASTLLLGDIPQDYWDSIGNLSDAVRAGDDTFECSSQEAYKWCMNIGTQAHLIPAACMMITDGSESGLVSYEDGVGHIYYKIPVDEYVARQEQFETDVENVLNSYIEMDDNDYEKCIKLYDYMETNYTYADDGIGDIEDGYVYHVFYHHEGQCIDLAGVYAFLLNQAGVEALSVGSFDNLDHEWVYALVNGRGYHIDPTWALKDELQTDDLHLEYFMMDDEIRTESGCPVEGLTVQLLPLFWASRSNGSFPAADRNMYLGNPSVFISLDEDNKIIHYYDEFDQESTFNYGE